MRSNASTMVTDVFLWLPTGFGTSICYEPVVCFNYKYSDGGTGGSCSVVLVVSPLVYLIMEAIAATLQAVYLVWLFLRITTTCNLSIIGLVRKRFPESFAHAQTVDTGSLFSSSHVAWAEEVRHAYGRARNSVSRIVSEHYEINVATALEVRFCTSRVELTRACRSTILGLRIVEKGLYCSCISVVSQATPFAERGRVWSRCNHRVVATTETCQDQSDPRSS